MRKNRAKVALKMTAITATELASAIGETLRRRYGDVRCATKRLARRTGRDERVIRNWMDGTHAPRLADAILLMRECDELADLIFRAVKDGRADD